MPSFDIATRQRYVDYQKAVGELLEYYGSFRQLSLALGVGKNTIISRLSRPYSIKNEHCFAAEYLLRHCRNTRQKLSQQE